MDNERVVMLRRAQAMGLLSAAAWTVSALIMATGTGNWTWAGPVVTIAAWIFTPIWIGIDARYREAPVFWWVAFGVIAAPLAAILYMVSRPHVPTLCSTCGAVRQVNAGECPACGHETLASRARSVLDQTWSALTESLSADAIERAKYTAKHMAIALGALATFAYLLGIGRYVGPGRVFVGFLWVLSMAAYWVLLPWWVYLDAKWRRMDAIPWAILTLVTNVFGLVTYLVIRYPDPRACPQCRAYLTIGLKRCPYCGSEAEPTCPRCQAPVKTDWVFCPACAAQLPSPGAAADPQTAPSMAVSGSVVDAISGLPVPGAEVGTDSKADRVFIHTDPLGRFMLSDLQPRPHVIVASAKGYVSEAKPFVPGDSSQLHFSLRPAEMIIADHRTEAPSPCGTRRVCRR